MEDRININFYNGVLDVIWFMIIILTICSRHLEPICTTHIKRTEILIEKKYISKFFENFHFQMGYGKRALKLLKDYYGGKFTDLNENNGLNEDNGKCN